MYGGIAEHATVTHTERTLHKLPVNTDLLVEGFCRIAGVTPTAAQKESLTALGYAALRWTADDVLLQTVADVQP